MFYGALGEMFQRSSEEIKKSPRKTFRADFTRVGSQSYYLIYETFRT
jgi:hypothetical protein